MKTYLIPILLLLLLGSCRLQRSLPPLPRPLLPERYEESPDSLNSADINWRQFFSDPQLTILIDTALKNNHDLLTVFQRIQSARAGVLLAEGARKPLTSLAAAAGMTRFGTYTMDGAGNRGTEIYKGGDIPRHLPDYFLGIQTSWEADLWGKLRHQKAAALARYLATVEGRAWVVTNLVADISLSYVELQALDQQLQIIGETIRLQDSALQMVRIQKQAGRVNELAVKQFEAQLRKLGGLKAQTLQSILDTEGRINLLAGRFPQPISRASHGPDPLPALIRTGIPAALLENRPDIRQARLELAATHADLKAAKAAFYPALSITGTLGLQAFRPDLVFSPTSLAYNLLGGLTAPVLNRAAIQAGFQQAGAAQLEALYQYQKAILTGFIEVYNEQKRLRNWTEQLDLKTSEAGLLDQSVDISSDLFRTGRANYLEVLFAQQAALQSKLELVDIRKGRFQSIVTIYRALGGGWR